MYYVDSSLVPLSFHFGGGVSTSMGSVPYFAMIFLNPSPGGPVGNRDEPVRAAATTAQQPQLPAWWWWVVQMFVQSAGVRVPSTSCSSASLSVCGSR